MPNERPDVALRALEAPLAVEIGDTDWINRHWPELQKDFQEVAIVRPPHDHAWTKRVTELLQLVRRRNSGALWWLLLLNRSKALTTLEAEDLTRIVWDGVGAGEFPQYEGLRRHVYFELPNVNQALLEEAYRQHIILPLSTGEISEEALDVGHAAGLRSPTLARFTKGEALEALPHLLAWRPSPISKWDDGRARAANTAISMRIGLILADVILPRLDTSDLPPGTGDDLLNAFVDEGRRPNLAIAAELLRLMPDAMDRITANVRAAIATREDETVRWALWSLERLLNSAHASAAPIKSLTQIIVDHCVYGREPGLLLCLRLSTKLVVQNTLRSEEFGDLLLALRYLFREMAYENWDLSDPRTREFTLIRAECVRLSAALEKAGHTSEATQSWLEEAGNDPTPEVRFALSAGDDSD